MAADFPVMLRTATATRHEHCFVEAIPQALQLRFEAGMKLQQPTPASTAEFNLRKVILHHDLLTIR
jgi:hypothetical protein